MTRQSITLSANNKSWLVEKSASGDFSSESEVVNHVIRAAREREEKLEWLRREVKAGRDSGLSTQSPREVIAELRAERAAAGPVGRG